MTPVSAIKSLGITTTSVKANKTVGVVIRMRMIILFTSLMSQFFANPLIVITSFTWIRGFCPDFRVADMN